MPSAEYRQVHGLPLPGLEVSLLLDVSALPLLHHFMTQLPDPVAQTAAFPYLQAGIKQSPESKDLP